jgi:hypothetical protein
VDRRFALNIDNWLLTLQARLRWGSEKFHECSSDLLAEDNQRVIRVRGGLASKQTREIISAYKHIQNLPFLTPPNVVKNEVLS